MSYRRWIDLGRNITYERMKACCVMQKFEKWRAIRASVGGVGGVLVWVAC